MNPDTRTGLCSRILPLFVPGSAEPYRSAPLLSGGEEIQRGVPFQFLFPVQAVGHDF